MPTAEQVRSVLERYCAAAGRGDVDALVECYAPGATVVDPYPGASRAGPDEIRAMFEERFSMARPVAFLFQREVVSEDRVAFLFSLEAVTEQHATIALDGIEVFTVGEDGLITDQVAYWDPSAIRVTPSL